jgi:hypothetical protein
VRACVGSAQRVAQGELNCGPVRNSPTHLPAWATPASAALRPLKERHCMMVEGWEANNGWQNRPCWDASNLGSTWVMISLEVGVNRKPPAQ